MSAAEAAGAGPGNPGTPAVLSAANVARRGPGNPAHNERS